MSIDVLPDDIMRYIGDIMVETNVYRDKYDIMRDAASLYCACKNEFTRGLSMHVLTAVVPLKNIGGYESPELFRGFEKKNINDLKTICKTLHVPLSGTKSKLIERITERKLLRYRLVLDTNLINDIENSRYRTVGTHVVKNVYGLNIQDMAGIEFTAGQGYPLLDIRNSSIIKYKNIHNLNAYQKQRSCNKKNKLDEKQSRIQSRRLQINDVFYKNNIQFTDCRMIDAYIKKGEGNILAITCELLELRFLKFYTQYDDLLAELEDVDIHEEINRDHYPTSLHTYCKQIALKKWIRTFEKRHMALNYPILPPSFKEMISKWPRYVWNISS
jgi:hypothetical protein